MPVKNRLRGAQPEPAQGLPDDRFGETEREREWEKMVVCCICCVFMPVSVYVSICVRVCIYACV